MDVFPAPGSVWNLDFGTRVTLSGGNGRGLIRNTGSLVLAVDELRVTSPVAATIVLHAGIQTGAQATCPIATSAGLLTTSDVATRPAIRYAHINAGSAAFPARAYYGTSGAATGVTISAGYEWRHCQIEAAGETDLASNERPILIWPSGVLAVEATPSSQQEVGVFARCWALTEQQVKA